MRTNPRIPYVSMVGQADQDLLPHIVRHYRALGVTEFHIALHGSFDRNTMALLEAEPDVSTYAVAPGAFDDEIKSKVLGEITEKLAGLWIIFVHAVERFLECV